MRWTIALLVSLALAVPAWGHSVPVEAAPGCAAESCVPQPRRGLAVPEDHDSPPASGFRFATGTVGIWRDGPGAEECASTAVATLLFDGGAQVALASSDCGGIISPYMDCYEAWWGVWCEADRVYLEFERTGYFWFESWNFDDLSVDYVAYGWIAGADAPL